MSAREVLARKTVLALGAHAADGVAALVNFREELGDFLGRILQIGVEGDDDLAARALEGRDDGHVLAVVAVEINHAHLLRALAGESAGAVRASGRGCRRW